MDQIAQKNMAIIKILETVDGGSLLEYFIELIKKVDDCECGEFESSEEEEEELDFVIDDKGFYSLV